MIGLISLCAASEKVVLRQDPSCFVARTVGLPGQAPLALVPQGLYLQEKTDRSKATRAQASTGECRAVAALGSGCAVTGFRPPAPETIFQVTGRVSALACALEAGDSTWPSPFHQECVLISRLQNGDDGPFAHPPLWGAA